MAEIRNQRIVSSIFYITLGFLIAMGGASATNKKLYRRSHGIITYATVLGKAKSVPLPNSSGTRKNNTQEIYILKLQFFDDQYQEHIAHADTIYKTWEKIAENDVIQILYDPQNPDENIIVVHQSRIISINIEIIFMLIGILMVYFGLKRLYKEDILWIQKKAIGV
ncbi:MAG: hypothetical protein KBD53_05620 [Candidatus Omnitrophica bacterium]|nr:hypothetical protein [Candidatus Omnitrophota bacterium]